MSWKSECKYMVPPVRICFNIDGETFYDDANRAVLRMRKTVARGLRNRWPLETILAQTIHIGKFIGSAELAPGATIIRGHENYFWELTLRPEQTQLAGPLHSRGRRAASSPRPRPGTRR